MVYPGGNPFNQPDGNNLYSVEYTEAVAKERRALAGLSRRGWELALATALAVVFLAWAIWVFVLF